jgi:hypothetical protein
MRIVGKKTVNHLILLPYNYSEININIFLTLSRRFPYFYLFPYLNFEFDLKLSVLSSGLGKEMMEHWNNGFWGIDGMGY